MRNLEYKEVGPGPIHFGPQLVPTPLPKPLQFLIQGRLSVQDVITLKHIH